MSVLEVRNVSIRYITGDFKDIGLKEYVLRKLSGNYHVTEFWADKDISFSLEKGEMLGIIGTNGAGKSTLLKVVSGIMEPTEGSVHREGNIAALLELASGFDGDLTVRENAYLRGAMLGYTRKFMDESYEQIIDFAELNDFQDRPFKQLSSGMKSRLAFAVASMVQPDLLILDEVLSVGDGAFQQKSAQKMQEIIHGGAATILVSHSLAQIRELSTKILWLDKGRQIAFGDDVKGLCDSYQRFLNGCTLSVGPHGVRVLFTDVTDPSVYYYEPVYWAVESHITTGKTPSSFSPEEHCTVGQVLTFIWRLMNRPEPSLENPFFDVKETDFFYKAVLWALERGLISEVKDSIFHPDSHCTQGDIIVYLWRLVGNPEATIENPFDNISPADSHYSAVLWAVESGIITDADHFSPDNSCTRGQAVTYLYRFNQSGLRNPLEEQKI